MSEQVTDLDGLSDSEIARLTREGRLDVLLGGEDPDEYGVEAARAEVLKAKAAQDALDGGEEVEVIDQDWLNSAPVHEVMKALKDGRLNHLL